MLSLAHRHLHRSHRPPSLRSTRSKREIGAKVVFHHLRTQGRIGDRVKHADGARRPSAIDKVKGLTLGDEGSPMPRVDMSADDRGYAEWYDKYWTADVATAAQKKAEAGESVLNSIEKMTGVDLDGDGDVGELGKGPGYKKLVDLEA